jgi:polyphosphate kinase
LTKQLGLTVDDVYPTDYFLGLNGLLKLEVEGRDDLRYPEHEPVTHPRLRDVQSGGPGAIFDEIRAGDILLQHPYHDFDSSVLRFIESAAVDPSVLAIKLTIYRTSGDSPIVRALAEASRRGKQVAVMVEITARFDEAPNIAWGQYLENEGVHVAYGVERLKTHVKLALVVREEGKRVRRYAHVGTGNYHTGTARLYEDLGILTADPEICNDVAAVFNSLTGTTPYGNHGKMLVAPVTMRTRFTELIRREAEHAREGRPSGITAKMNQLQDPGIIKELYQASQAGVPISLNVRGLCCLRPGVPGLSENIRVFGVVGRFLEHSRVYRFANAGSPEYYLGSADWMRRNLNNRVETIVPVLDKKLMGELDRILEVYDTDNSSAWDCGPDGVYTLRTPEKGEERRAVQDDLIRLAAEPRKTATAPLAS